MHQDHGYDLQGARRLIRRRQLDSLIAPAPSSEGRKGLEMHAGNFKFRGGILSSMYLFTPRSDRGQAYSTAGLHTWFVSG